MLDREASWGHPTFWGRRVGSSRLIHCQTMNTKAVGDRSEAMVIAFLLKAGLSVLKPFGDNQRYDLVIDVKGSFYRIQCKTGHLKGVRSHCVRFPTASTYAHRGGKRRGYGGQVELFGVYCPETDEIYFVDPSSVGKAEGTIILKDYKFDIPG